MPPPISASKLIPEKAEEFYFADQYPNALAVLMMHNEDVASGKVKPHKWQIDLLLELSRTRIKGESIKAMLVAANGSGKSQYVLAPFAVWIALVFKESLTVVTTASGDQLDTQSARYITRLCQNINQTFKEAFGYNVFDLKFREVRGNITKSFIDLFATDEPGKAEGRHPLSSDGEFVLIVDEAKTVANEIFEALERCKGKTRRLELSSPGDCRGYFYNTWVNDGYKCYRRRVTAFDCPHISKEENEESIQKYGINDPLIRSSIFAEFVSSQEETVVPRDLLQKSIRIASCPTAFGPLMGGLDLSSGGDESVLSVWNGNMEVGLHYFRNVDTTKTVNSIIETLKEYRGKLEASNIWADDGGIGRSMIDNLNEKGYRVRRVLNQTRAFDTTRYANRGTELWFNFKRFVEEYQVIFLLNEKGSMDQLLFSQLSNRYYRRQTGTGKLILESKAEARKNGHPSPDRADAVVLAWAGRVYPMPEISGVKAAAPVEESSQELGARLERECREKLRNKFIQDMTNARDGVINVNSNVRQNGTYVTTERFGYSYNNIFPEVSGKRSITSSLHKK